MSIIAAGRKEPMPVGAGNLQEGRIIGCLSIPDLVIPGSSVGQQSPMDVSAAWRSLRSACAVYQGEIKAMQRLAQQSLFYGIKLPFMLVLIVLGFMMETLVELPFALMTHLDGRRR